VYTPYLCAWGPEQNGHCVERHTDARFSAKEYNTEIIVRGVNLSLCHTKKNILDHNHEVNIEKSGNEVTAGVLVNIENQS
jgi:hypothetical protein